MTILSRIIWLAALVGLAVSARAEVLVDTDFGRNLAPLPESENISGTLPADAKEDSGWADLELRYETIADRLGSNLRWTRVHLERLDKGRGQLKWEIPTLEEETAFRVRITAGSNTDTRIRAALRQAVPPYHSVWEEDIELGMGRETLDFEFRAKAQEKPVAFFLIFPEVGEVDLYSLRVETVSEEDLERQRAAAVAAAPDNLLPWSGFPLGLTGAWGVKKSDSLETEMGFEAASSTDANGTVPLRIIPMAKDSWNLYSPPFEMADPGSIHALSFLVRGEGTGRVRILADGKAVPLEREFGGVKEPTRVVVPFRPDEHAKWHVIHWEGKGPLEISSLMINHGKEPLAFQRQAPVGLVIDGNYENGQVFVEGVESPSIRYHAGDLEAPADLRIRVTDLYGDTREGNSVSVSPASPEGLIGLEEIGLPLKYGSYRVEAVLEQNGTPVSPVAEVVIHYVRKPHFWGRIAPESKFGNHFHNYEPHMYAAKAIGINWNRFHGGNGYPTYWSGVEPRPGEWRWHKDLLRQFRDHGFALLGVWTHVPGWARIERPEAGGWLDNWWQPADYEKFGDYVARSSQEYAGLIDGWQIWNEPWGEFWFKEWRGDLKGEARWHRGETPEEDFLRLSEIAWDRSRGILPDDFPVLGFGATVGERGKRWMQDMLDLGAEHYCNVVSYHAYLGGELREAIDPYGSNSLRLDRRIFEPVSENEDAREMPLWMTEGNWFPRRNKTDTGLYHHTVHGDADSLSLVRHNAVRIPLYHALLFAGGTDKVFLYALSAGPPSFRVLNPGKIDWSSMITPAGELHPSATAYAAMTHLLEPAAFADTLQFENSHAAYVFSRDTSDNAGSLALVFGPKAREFALSRIGDSQEIQMLDLLGNPADDRIEHEMVYLVAPSLSPDSLAERLRLQAESADASSE